MFGLNPFEVREVLQGICVQIRCPLVCLKPFEVREVLQGLLQMSCVVVQVSIPLKSGRCCKPDVQELGRRFCLNPFEVREVLQARAVLTCAELTGSQSL